jgi:hypothetical protein
MKKLLLLMVCVLLLLCATAGPALAQDTYPPYPSLWYGVMLWDGSVWWINETNHTYGQVNAVPAGYPYVAINASWYCADYGQCLAQSGSLLQTLDLGRKGQSAFFSLDPVAARGCWTRPYDPAASYGAVGSQYNPKEQAGFWAIDWTVWIGPLTRGTYWYHYRDYQAHQCVDPLFEKLPIHYPPSTEWTDHGIGQFNVR